MCQSLSGSRGGSRSYPGGLVKGFDHLLWPSTLQVRYIPGAEGDLWAGGRYGLYLYL